MLRLFRWIALIEGVTTLALFLIAMPLKYALGWPLLVHPVGWVHGIAYIAAMVAILPAHPVGLVGSLRTLLAAFLPFHTFLDDRFLKRFEAPADAEQAAA